MKNVAFISGTSKGIGKSIAELLLSEKYIVYGFSRSNTINHKNFIFVKTDFSDVKKIEHFEFPEIDKITKVLLINNAATIGEIRPLGKRDNTQISEEINLNLISPTILSNQLIKQYYDSEKLIINISSGAAKNAIPSWSIYCITKSGLDMLSSSLKEEKHNKLRVFSVSPGVVDTNMQLEIRNSDKNSFPLHQKFVDYFINNELLSPESVALKIYRIIADSANFRP